MKNNHYFNASDYFRDFFVWGTDFKVCGNNTILIEHSIFLEFLMLLKCLITVTCGFYLNFKSLFICIFHK